MTRTRTITRSLAGATMVPVPALGLSASGSSTTPSAAPVISITDFTFAVPASVAAGATVTVKNAYSQAHTVTSKTGGFDVKVDPNGTATVDRSGQGRHLPVRVLVPRRHDRGARREVSATPRAVLEGAL